MATYLPGVTDSGFNPVLSSPNLPFLMSALQKVTARYEKNYDEMSQGYSSILNADIINDVKSKERNGYLDKIKDKLKTISTTDLSVQSNIDEANSLYTPFWEDKSMLSHIADTKARKNQLLQQEKIKKEHPDYDNYTPTTVMNYYMNKIKTAENPDIINEVPLISAVALKNNPKEFQEWLKKNEWKQEASVAQDGRIYKQINGDDSLHSYSELFRTYLGNSAQDQYNMYGEYFKIQAIQDIQADSKKNLGIDISDEEAVKKIPDYYIKEQLKNYDLKKENLLNEISVVEKNIKNFGSDPLRLKAFNEKLILIDDAFTEINKEYDILKNQGGTDEKGKEKYKELVNNIIKNPTNFFASMTLDKDIQNAAKMAASNQSLTISTDEATFKMLELQQKSNEFVQTLDYKYKALAAKMQEDADGNLTSSTKEGKGKDGDTETKWENAVPTVNKAESNNDIASAVTRFEKIIKTDIDEGMDAIVNVVQSTNSDIFSGIITPQEMGIIAKNYQSGEVDKDYNTILDKAKKSLLLKNNISKEAVNNIKNSAGLIMVLGDYYAANIQEKIRKKTLNVKNGTPDKDLDASILDDYKNYTAIETAKTKINNAYASKSEFDLALNNKIQSNPEYYKKVSIVKKDGTRGIITAEDLSENKKYRLELLDANGNKTGKFIKHPVGLMQQYIDGTLDLKFDAKKTEANYEAKYEKELDNQGFFTELFFGKKIKKDDSKTNYNSYYALDPETKIKHDVTPIVEDYGTPEELHKRLSKTIDSDKSLIPSKLYKGITERTGQMGRTITWTSSIRSDKDVADRLTNDFLQNIKNNVIQTDDNYSVINASEDLAKKLNSDVIPEIISNPTKGLTAFKYNPIGSVDPSKRNITLVYDQTVLLGKDAKDLKKLGWDGSVTFEIRSDAELPGLPKVASGSFYDMLLSGNTKGIKQTKVDEDFGLKYEMYKDQNNQIQYKIGYQDIVVDKETNVLSYVWKSFNLAENKTGPYSENGGFSVLPSNVTIEDVIERARQVMYSSIIPNNNTTIQKHYPSTPPVSITDQKTIDELNKSNNNILNKYR
jgi:hypothetical protein